MKVLKWTFFWKYGLHFWFLFSVDMLLLYYCYAKWGLNQLAAHLNSYKRGISSKICCSLICGLVSHSSVVKKSERPVYFMSVICSSLYIVLSLKCLSFLLLYLSKDSCCDELCPLNVVKTFLALYFDILSPRTGGKFLWSMSGMYNLSS